MFAVFLTMSLLTSGVTMTSTPVTQDSVRTGESKLYIFSVKTIDGEDRSLSAYKGKVLLIVNVASKCGYTPQYEGLEKLFDQYKDQGFMVLGFPANNFLWQEPGSDAEIKEFCSLTYNVSFDMFSKVSVKGDDQHPLYTYLTQETSVPGSVRWNFQKYLVNKKGVVVDRFAPATEPMDKEVVTKIEALLAEPS